MPRGAKRTKGKVETARTLPRRTRVAPAKPASVPPAEARLAEALAQQEATGEILRVIRRSPGDTQPVFDMIAERATRLCGALHGGVMRFDGRLLEVAAYTPVSPAFDEALRRIYPMAPGRGTAAARAILTRAVVQIPDITRDRAYELTDSMRAAGFRGALAVPMLRDGAAVGVIVVFRAEVGRFPERQVALLQTFADQAVIAVENARLVGALGERNRELTETLERQTATGEILRAMSTSPTDVQPVFEAIVRSAARLCEAEFSTVARFEDGMLHLAAVSNMSLAETRAYHSLFPRPPRRNFIIGRAFLEGRPVHVEDVLTDPEYDPRTLEVLQTAATYRSYLAVPIVRNGAVIGVIGCGRRRMRPFTASQIELVKTFADQAVIAIENVRLFRELQTRNDELTESLEQQTATSDILRVISSSPTDVQPVFDAVAESAARLCESFDSAIWRRDGDRLLLVAHHGPIPIGPVGEFVLPLIRGTAAGRAVADVRAVHVADMQREVNDFPESSSNAQHMGFRTILCVPLIRKGTAIGCIQLRRTEARLFSERQVALLQTFADQGVIAIENVRLFTEVQERNRALSEALDQQTATGEILRAISSSPTDTQPVFDMIARNARRLCEADSAAVFTYDGRLIHLEALDNVGYAGADALRLSYPLPVTEGHATGRVILQGRPVHIQDAQADREFNLTGVLGAGVRTVLGVPMLRDGTPVGVIVLHTWSTPRPFSESQIALLETFADQAVIAIQNVRLFTEVQERNQDLTETLEQQTATGEILRAISSSPTDTQPVFEMITRNARRLCAADSCAVFTYDGQLIHLQALDNMGYAGADALRQYYPAPVSEGHAGGRAILQGRPVHIEDTQADPDYVLTALVEAGMRTILAVPMMRDGAAVGLIVLHSWTTARPFSDGQIALLETFADQAVIAIENVRLFTELEARNAALTTALEQQTATADVLSAMSASATDAQPVFDAIVRNAARLCHARFALAYQLVGDVIHFVSQHNLPPAAAAQFQRTFPQRLSESGTLIARAIQRGEVINVPDILADRNVAESVRELARSSGYRSVIAVPIMREGRALGALAITRSDPREEIRPFSDEEIPILQTFTEQAGIAIENVRLFNELEARTAQLTRSVGELQALGEVSQAVGSTLDLDAVLETIVGRAVQLSGSDQGVIYEFDDAGQTFHQRATHGMSAEYVRVMETAPIRVGEGVIGRAAITRQAVEVVDMQKDSQLLAAQVRERLIRQDMGSLLALPLVREDRILGGLVVIRRQRGAFSPDVVAMLKTFAAQSVLAIHNARLFREIQRQKQYSDTLMETSPVAIVTLDLAGLVTSWNPGAERLFGHSPAEALGHRMEDLVSTPEGREEVRANVRQTLEGQWTRAMGRRARKDGTRVDLDISSVPVIVEGARVGMIAIYHDITELLKARQEAETANEAKSAFLATMSHEIRTPMNAVIGMSGLLLNTRLSEEQRDYAEVIRQSGDTLLTVINDILDFSKIEAGRLELEAQPFDLRECVEGALDLVATRAAEKGVDLAYMVGDGVPPGVIGDVTRLRQVLLNLLSNAVKFTDRGEVVLSVAARPPAHAGAPHELAFSVRDTGIGIPADRLDRLFQSFSQVDTSTTRRYGGTGLGLAISQRLTEMMGGTITVTSQPGIGSEFSFTIPAQASEVPVQVHRDLSGVQPTLRGKRVLVVDDNATNRRIVTVHLDTWGIPSRATESPLEALEWLRAGEHFDIAILDMHMPEMDGVSLARALRPLPAGAGLPLILFTSLGRREARAEDEGFAAYLHKPIKPSQLFDALSSVLSDQPIHVAARGATTAELDPELAARHPLRILLAEDNVVNQKVALRLLAQMGYRADVAANGLEAIEAVARQTYDVVLMDVQMPEMDGFEASREINRRFRSGRPRIVAMTANAMQGDRELCVAAGMDDYVAKPIRIEELVGALRRVPPHREAPTRTGASSVSPDPGAPTEAAADGAGAIDRAVFDRLLATTGGPFVAELIDTFGEDARDLLAALRRTLATQDVDGFRRAAHSLKSTAESLGATALGALARELEGQARTGSLEGAAEGLDRLDHHCTRAAGALGDLRRDLSA
jgi:PAS domain S-box-containing protein